MDLSAILALFPQLAPYAGYLAAAVAIASIISTLMPSPSPDSSQAYRTAYQVIQWVALLKGHATPLSSPAATGIVGGHGAMNNPQIATASKPATQGPTP